MFRHRLLAAGLAAALTLPLAACSVQVTGTPRAASSAPVTTESTETTPTETTPADTGTSEVSTTTPIPPTEPTSTTESAATDPSDAPSVAWLTTFCVAFTDIGKYTSPDTTGMSIDAALQTIVDAYNAMSEIALAAADDLRAMPEPHFANHEQVVPLISDWFSAVGQNYAQGANTIATTEFTSEDQIVQTVQDIEAGLDDANTHIAAAEGLIDQPTKDVMLGLPECDSLTQG